MSAILAAILDFSKLLFSAKMQQIFLKFSQSQIRIKLRIEWKKGNYINFCQKVTVFVFKL